MKRHGGLWQRLVSFGNLLTAAQTAARGKRRSANVARFNFNLEKELFALQAELLDGSYRPGPYVTFTIHEPKTRMISAAPFRDRVVHHALYNVLEPIFERVFIHDTYACRKGKGTHAAVDRFTHFARRHRYVLKCDVRKYFPSIDHAILKALIARTIKDRAVLALVERIIDHSNLQEPVQAWFPGDDLFTPVARRRGLPLGNQTSQFFANAYLNPFDHFVQERLRPGGYLRYVDDFVLFHDDKAWLGEARDRCGDQLASLRLRLHPDKSVISRVEDGTRFLGYRVFPSHRLLPRENVRRMRKRCRDIACDLLAGRLSQEGAARRINGWLGHARQADTWRLRRRLLAGISFAQGL